MKKRVVILTSLIIISTIVLSSFILVNTENPIKDYLKGSLESGKLDLSIFVKPPVPVLTIISPENTTYSTTDISFEYTIKLADSVWYNLDNTENITLSAPYDPIFFTFSEGTYILYIYANNTYGISTKTITFTIDLSQPPVETPDSGGTSRDRTEPETEEPKNETPKNETTITNIIEVIKEIPKEIIVETGINILLIITIVILLFVLVIILTRKKDNQKKKSKPKTNNLK